MQPLTAETVILSLFLTWGIGLTPPLLIRFAVLKRALAAGHAVATCAVLWVANLALFTVLGSQSKSHFALTLVAFVSYWILRAGWTDKEEERQRRRRAAKSNTADDDGVTPLMSASAIGNIKQMVALIGQGAEVNATDKRGWTALMYAANHNESEAVLKLLLHGADSRLTNANGETALNLATQGAHVDAEATLRENIPQAIEQEHYSIEQR